MVTRRRMLMVPAAATAAAVVHLPGAARARRQIPPAPPEPAHRGPWIRAPYDTYVRNPLVADSQVDRALDLKVVGQAALVAEVVSILTTC